MDENCYNCKYYENEDTYPGTGWCGLVGDYTKDNDDCEDYEAEQATNKTKRRKSNGSKTRNEF